jgi:hypothetical protein
MPGTGALGLLRQAARNQDDLLSPGLCAPADSVNPERAAGALNFAAAMNQVKDSQTRPAAGVTPVTAVSGPCAPWGIPLTRLRRARYG